MTARPVMFRQADVERAVRAVEKAGVSVGVVEISGDTIRVFAKDATQVPTANPLDKWLTEQ